MSRNLVYRWVCLSQQVIISKARVTHQLAQRPNVRRLIAPEAGGPTIDGARSRLVRWYVLPLNTPIDGRIYNNIVLFHMLHIILYHSSIYNITYI